MTSWSPTDGSCPWRCCSSVSLRSVFANVIAIMPWDGAAAWYANRPRAPLGVIGQIPLVWRGHASVDRWDESAMESDRSTGLRLFGVDRFNQRRW